MKAVDTKYEEIRYSNEGYDCILDQINLNLDKGWTFSGIIASWNDMPKLFFVKYED